jgi:16S rRNA (adenine1518-N6/adenine1519-N6)-dimethyltransferase
VLRRIADSLDLTSADTVIEIGPGRGALTEELLPRAGRVIAIEIDRALSELLRGKYGTHPRFTLVESDVLKVDLGAVAGGRYVVAGNVPYNITSPILFHTLRRPRAERSVFLVQREVAERIVAPPGSEEYGALSINVQALATAEILFRVPPGAFRPPPKVDSAVIRVTPRPDPIVKAEDEERFSRLVIDAFTMRRKQMRKIVREMTSVTAEEAERVLEEAGIDPDSRPETLSPEQFARLLAAIT